MFQNTVQQITPNKAKFTKRTLKFTYGGGHHVIGGTDFMSGIKLFPSSYNIKLHRNSGCASPKGRTYE